jgi:hypothetical protein
VTTDDLLKSSPHLAPRRPTAGITPQLSDAELVTLAMMQAILGLTSEARWLRTPGGVIVRVLQRLLALTAAIWHNQHTGQPIMRSLTPYGH